jgi:hypothetical protein
VCVYSLLLIEFVAATAVGNSAERALERKDKRPLPIPVEFYSYSDGMGTYIDEDWRSFVVGGTDLLKCVTVLSILLSSRANVDF